MENDNSTQYDKLIQKNEIFDISKEELNSLVKNENIESGKSYELIEKIGGIKEWIDKLDVCPRNGWMSEDFNNENIIIQSSITINKTLLRQIKYGKFDPCWSVDDYKSFTSCFISALNKKFLFILWAGAIKVIINQLYRNGYYIDYISWFAFVLIIVLSNTYTKYLLGQLFYKYQINFNERDIRVWRNKTEKIIPVNKVMVGDIVIITSGDILSVDGIVLKTFELSLENSHGVFRHYSAINYLTSESISDLPILQHGTKIIKGYALLLALKVDCSCSERAKKNIVFTSDNSLDKSSQNRKYTWNESWWYEDYMKVERAHNDSYISNIPTQMKFNFILKDTPIQSQLNSLSDKLFYIGTFISFIITLLNFITLYRTTTIDDYIYTVLNSVFYFCVILIFIVPVGSELSFSIPFVRTIRTMQQEKLIIKNSSAYEQIAGVNNICTEYYGILTGNNMSIDEIFIDETHMNATDTVWMKGKISEDMFMFFCESIAVNTIAFTAEKNGDIKYFGNDIECCLIKFLNTWHVNYSDFRNKITRPIIASSPYLSENKISYTVIKMEDKWNYNRLYVKGSVDMILDNISKYINPGCVEDEITDIQRDQIKIKSEAMERAWILPLIIGYRDIPITEYNEETSWSNLVKNLTFICWIGVKDERSEWVREYLGNWKQMGVNLKLVTDQNFSNSKRIAKALDLIDKEAYMSSWNLLDNTIIKFINNEESPKKSKFPKFRKLSSRSKTPKHYPNWFDAGVELKKYLKVFFNSETKAFDFNIYNKSKFNLAINTSSVIANAKSKDKFIYIASLRKRGHYVAYTGTTISDAISMQTANIGITINDNSNDIAKSSSDIIISDSTKLSSLILLIIHGRNLYDCVRKFLQFQLSFILGILLFIVTLNTPLFNYTTIDTNVIIYLILIISIVESIAISYGNPDPNILMDKAPNEYDFNTFILSRNLIIRIWIQGWFMYFILVIVVEISVYYQYDIIGMSLTCLVYLIVFNATISKLYEDDIMYLVNNWSEHIVFILLQVLIVFAHSFLMIFNNWLVNVHTVSIAQSAVCLMASALMFACIPLIYYLWENMILFDVVGENGGDDNQSQSSEIYGNTNKNVDLSYVNIKEDKENDELGSIHNNYSWKKRKTHLADVKQAQWKKKRGRRWFLY